MSSLRTLGRTVPQADYFALSEANRQLLVERTVALVKYLAPLSSKRAFFKDVGVKLLQLSEEEILHAEPPVAENSGARESSSPAEPIKRRRLLPECAVSGSPQRALLSFDLLSPDVVVTHIFSYLNAYFEIDITGSPQFGIFCPELNAQSFASSEVFHSLCLFGRFSRDRFRHPWFLYHTLTLDLETEDATKPAILSSVVALDPQKIRKLVIVSRLPATIPKMPNLEAISLHPSASPALFWRWVSAMSSTRFMSLSCQIDAEGELLQSHKPDFELISTWRGSRLVLSHFPIDIPLDSSQLSRLAAFRSPSYASLENVDLEVLQIQGDVREWVKFFNRNSLSNLRKLSLSYFRPVKGVVFTAQYCSFDHLEFLSLTEADLITDAFFRQHAFPALKILRIRTGGPSSLNGEGWRLNPQQLVEFVGICVPCSVLNAILRRGVALQKAEIRHAFIPANSVCSCGQWAVSDELRSLRIGLNEHGPPFSVFVRPPKCLEYYCLKPHSRSQIRSRLSGLNLSNLLELKLSRGFQMGRDAAEESWSLDSVPLMPRLRVLSCDQPFRGILAGLFKKNLFPQLVSVAIGPGEWGVDSQRALEREILGSPALSQFVGLVKREAKVSVVQLLLLLSGFDRRLEISPNPPQASSRIQYINVKTISASVTSQPGHVVDVALLPKSQDLDLCQELLPFDIIDQFGRFCSNFRF